MTDLARHEDIFSEFCASHTLYVPSCEAYTAERLRNASAQSIVDNFESGRKGLGTKAERVLKNYINLIVAYNAEFSTLIPADIEKSDEISGTLERLEQSELPQYRERISRARSDAEREFKEHFIAKLNEYIIEAKESFKEINDTLKTMTFGRDQYSFTLEERADRRAQIHVVQKAAEITAYEDGLFAQIINPEEREATETLFKNIISADLDSVEMRSICDYRTYFTYDIRMRDTQTIDPVTGKAAELSLSRVLREKSGGESQTPYYVAIAASFYRFFKEKEDSAVRFVLFDEAFDKLDDERIGKVIDFYARMNIQLAVAVPTEKIESIAPKMDQINLVIRHGHTAHVRPYSSSADSSYE